jgi:hypothetical protein
MSTSKFNDLEKVCTNDHCPPDRASDIDDGKRFQTFANIGLAVGAVGLASSVVLFLISPSSPEKPKPAADTEVGLGLGSVQVRGRF